MIRHTCPDCGQPLESAPAMAGQMISCKTCFSWTQVPSALSQVSAPDTDAETAHNIAVLAPSPPVSSGFRVLPDSSPSLNIKRPDPMPPLEKPLDKENRPEPSSEAFTSNATRVRSELAWYANNPPIALITAIVVLLAAFTALWFGFVYPWGFAVGFGLVTIGILFWEND